MTYKRGESGNLKGRPKGVIDRRAPWRKLIEDNAEEIINQLVARAIEGDFEAQKFCVERLIAKPRDNPMLFELPANMQDAVKVVDEVLESASTGEITLQEAKHIADIVDVRTRAETKDRVTSGILEVKEWVAALNEKPAQVVVTEESQTDEK